MTTHLALASAPAAGGVLKGDSFTQRLRELCRDLPEPHPLAGIRHRRVLIPGLIGGEIQFALLGLAAHALRLRGAEVTALMCDALLPACTLRKIDHHEPACSRWCERNAGPFARAARLPHRWYSEFISPEEFDDCLQRAFAAGPRDITAYECDGIPVGEHLPRSLSSVFRVGSCDVERPTVLAKARELLAAGLCLVIVGRRAIEQLRPDKVFMDDGMKIDWGVMRDVARRRGVPVHVVLGAPRGNALLVERDRWPAPSEPFPGWERWRDVALTAAQERELDDYFHARALRPYEDQQWSDVTAAADDAAVRRALALSEQRGGLVLAMFPNLSWDAAVTTTDPAYTTAAEWVVETIRLMARWPQHTLVIKAHPAERWQTALDPTADVLRQTFASLPANVRLLPPETSLTAHDVLRACDVALVYTSTVGLEAMLLGRPVVNVGGGWHAGRGLSSDARTPGDYARLLAECCAGRPPAPASRELARRYAYTVFFRYTLPIRHYSAIFPNVTSINLRSLEDLRPGRDSTIDVLCDTILCDARFERSD